MNALNCGFANFAWQKQEKKLSHFTGVVQESVPLSKIVKVKSYESLMFELIFDCSEVTLISSQHYFIKYIRQVNFIITSYCSLTSTEKKEKSTLSVLYREACRGLLKI